MIMRKLFITFLLFYLRSKKMKQNIAVNINLKGGFLGLFSSPKNIIKNTLENYNNQGSLL